MKVCTAPGCPVLVSAGHARCQQHARTYGQASKKMTHLILARDGYHCAYCGERADTKDHLIPVVAGGQMVADNLVAACRHCNRAKGDRLA